MAIYGDEKHNENMVHEEPAFQEIYGEIRIENLCDECLYQLQQEI